MQLNYSDLTFYLAIALLIAAMVSVVLGISLARPRRRSLIENHEAEMKIFSAIGHGLRGPIGNLKMSLDLLADDSLSDKDRAEIQTSLGVGVDQAYEILENLMLWAQAEMSSLQPSPTTVNLREIAGEAMRSLANRTEEKGIVVENTIPPSATVQADMRQIQSVLRNLLSNALKFTAKSGRIVFHAHQDKPGYWSLTVQDNGVGMTQDLSERLLGRKDKYVSTLGTENEQGLGLGLLICREVIRANKGTLSVQSQVGQGAAFQFLLPMTAGEPV